MPFVPAANVIEVFIEHSFNNKDGIGWVFHYKPTTAPISLEKLLDLGQALAAWWNTDVKPLVANTTHLTRVRLRDISVQNGIVADYTTGMPITGTRAGAAMPANVSLSLKKNTGYAGRSFRGRVYWLGITEGDVTNNAVATTYINDIVDALQEAIIIVGAVDEYEMVVVSKYNSGNPRPTGLATLVQTFSVADNVVDTRRDRL